MILQSLYELYDRLSRDREYDISPLGYSKQKIAFKVVLRPDGTLHAIEDIRKQIDKKFVPRYRNVPGSTKSSGSGFNPGFLWDNTGYMLGYKANDKNAKRTLQSFETFRDMHCRYKSAINSLPYQAVCTFLENWNPENAEQYPVLKDVATGFGVFQMLGQEGYIHSDQAVQEWWARRQDDEDDNVSGRCLITGEISSLARLHKPRIKRVGDQAESLLVSFNDPSYTSYGKEQSYNAPVSKEAAFRYATALNALLDGPKSHKHRFTLADATIVFWTKEPTYTEDIFAQFAMQGSAVVNKQETQDEDLRHRIELFLKALRQGRDAYSDIDKAPDRTPFFILGLTGQAKGRIGVRFFCRDTISNLLDNLRQHYQNMAIVRNGKKNDPEFPALWQLLDETCPRRNGKPDRDKIPPILSGPLLRAVITKARYPDGLYNAVMRRICVDGNINYARACIIKGYLTRNRNKEVSMALDPNRKDPAYRLGRLFAALEKTQEDALGKLNSTIRDRFYSAASATPCAVFPRLLRTYQHHLSNPKMDKWRIGREILVRDILEPVTTFPAHMNLTDQGIFAIGYYHQMRDFWTSKEDKEQEKGGAE